GLAPEHLGQLALAARPREYPPGTVLFREGEVSASVYLVLRGSVGLEVEAPGRGPVPAGAGGAGELLGWSPVLGTGPMTATARTPTWCGLAALEAARLLELGQRDSCFGTELLRRTAAVVARRLAVARRAAGGLRDESLAPQQGP